VRARIERRAQDVGLRTFGLMRFSTVSFGNTSLAIAAQSAHQAALAELGSSNPVPSRGSQVRTAIVPPELPVEAGPGAILHRGTEGSNPSPSSAESCANRISSPTRSP
jgi:hypothetical protein